MADQFSINRDTVEALKDLRGKLADGADSLMDECSRMYDVTIEYSATLGPHAKEVIEVIERISELLSPSADSIRERGERVRRLGGSYEGVIDSQGISQVKRR